MPPTANKLPRRGPQRLRAGSRSQMEPLIEQPAPAAGSSDHSDDHDQGPGRDGSWHGCSIRRARRRSPRGVSHVGRRNGADATERDQRFCRPHGTRRHSREIWRGVDVPAQDAPSQNSQSQQDDEAAATAGSKRFQKSVRISRIAKTIHEIRRNHAGWRRWRNPSAASPAKPLERGDLNMSSAQYQPGFDR